MASKIRILHTFTSSVAEFSQNKCEFHGANIQRAIKIICSLENLTVFSVEQPDVVEFLISVHQLLKLSEPNTDLGWKTIQLIKHLCSDTTLCSVIKSFDVIPLLIPFIDHKDESENFLLLLSTLELLTDGIKIERVGSWVVKILENISQRILQKHENKIPHLLAVLSNICHGNYIAIIELQRLPVCEELLQFLIQLQTADPLTQLYAAQVVFSCLAVGSLNNGLLKEYICTVSEALLGGLKSGNHGLINRCNGILKQISGDNLLIEMIHSPELQKKMQEDYSEIIKLTTLGEHIQSMNSGLSVASDIIEMNLIADKKFTDESIFQLIPLLRCEKVLGNCLKLIATLFKQPSVMTLIEQTNEEEAVEHLISTITTQINTFQVAPAYELLGPLWCGLQILQKLCKIARLNAKISSVLQPETFALVISKVISLSENRENQGDSNAGKYGASRIVAESLSLLGQIACRGGEWLQSYSSLLEQHSVQNCLADAILFGDCHLKQIALSLVGTLGFSTNSVIGLSRALTQLGYTKTVKRVMTMKEEEPRNVKYVETLNPIQAKRIDQLIFKLHNQDNFLDIVKKSDVLELMELRTVRLSRENDRCRRELDHLSEQIRELKLGQYQIQVENEKLLSMVVAKDEMLVSKEAEIRGLVRTVEYVKLQVEQAKLLSVQEKNLLNQQLDSVKKEKNELEEQSRYEQEALKKQNRILSEQIDESRLKLEESTKICEDLRKTGAKAAKDIEQLEKKLKEAIAVGESLKLAVVRHEKEKEDNEKEISSLRQALEKKETQLNEIETRKTESEKRLQETLTELQKLKRIQEFIHDISSGKKKFYEE